MSIGNLRFLIKRPFELTYDVYMLNKKGKIFLGSVLLDKYTKSRITQLPIGKRGYVGIVRGMVKKAKIFNLRVDDEIVVDLEIGSECVW